MRYRVGRIVPAMLLVVVATVTARAERASDAAGQKTEFMRFVDDQQGGGKLQTAIVDYTNDAGVTVHLVAAVHIADKPYYDKLNKTFDGYDAVLYEMVKPKGAGVPKAGEHRNNSMISIIQRFMKDALELSFQLDAIDYTKENFVHADLTYEDFQKMEEERGESIWTLMLQQMLKQMMNPPENQQQIDTTDLLAALTSPDRARQLKLIIGRQFGDIEDQMAGFAGTVLITERNKACFRVLKSEMADGKKDIGIFYGAGHMSDMEKRLLKRGFHKTGEQWLDAWDMSADKAKADADDDDDADAKPAPKHADHAKPAPKEDSDDDDADAKPALKHQAKPAPKDDSDDDNADTTPAPKHHAKPAPKDDSDDTDATPAPKHHVKAAPKDDDSDDADEVNQPESRHQKAGAKDDAEDDDSAASGDEKKAMPKDDDATDDQATPAPKHPKDDSDSDEDDEKVVSLAPASPLAVCKLTLRVTFH